MHYINHNLRFYREYNRLTQQEIAGKLKTTLGRIKMYDRDGATPQIEMLIKIADMMQVSLDTLVRVKLNERNYLHKKGEGNPDLAKRVGELEITVNNFVNKIPEKRVKMATVKK